MRRLLSFLIATSLCVVAVSAQSRPSFAGQWTVLPATNAPFGELGQRPLRFFNDPRSSLGIDITITQDASRLTVEYVGPPNPAVFNYRLDGTESRNTPPPAGDPEVISTASWKDGKLIIVSTQKDRGPVDQPITIQMTQELSLAPDGTLVVESTNRGRTVTRIYKKRQ